MKQIEVEPQEKFSQALFQDGVFSFCSFITQRQCYKLGDVFYVVAEFEVMVDSIEKIQEAEKKIQGLLKKLHIDSSITVPAKLTYYLYHRRPSHYEALLNHKIIKAF